MQALLDFLLSFAEISQTTLRLVGRSFMKVYSRKDLLSHIERCEGKFPPEIVLDVELKKVPLISFFLRSLIMPMDIVVLFQFPHPQNTFVSINMLLLFDREFKDSFVPLYLEEFPRIYKNTCKHLLDNYSAFIEFVIEVQYCEVDRDPYAEENELLRETLLKLGFAMRMKFTLKKRPNRWVGCPFLHPFVALIDWYTEAKRPFVYDTYINSLHCQLFHAGSAFSPSGR